MKAEYAIVKYDTVRSREYQKCGSSIEIKFIPDDDTQVLDYKDELIKAEADMVKHCNFVAESNLRDAVAAATRRKE